MDKMVVILSAHNFVDTEGLELYVNFLDTINK
jgi:hypothetical protein